MTNREPSTAIGLTATEYTAFANECRQYAATFDKAAEAAREHNQLAAFNVKTGQAALLAVGNFCDFVEKSLRDLRLGKPLKHGDLKARTTAIKRGLPSIPEGKAALAAHRKKRPKRPN
jgi:hypothetical protein